jgi:membrane associated rhomboid family serine protease
MGVINFMNSLKHKYEQFNVSEKLILINILCFVLPYCLHTLLFLLDFNNNSIISYFELSANLKIFIFRPWTILTYSFFHSGFLHLFWNMLLFYYSSRLFINLFPQKMLLTIYFLGVITGGLVFILSYSIFPAFRGISPSMLGASAGVMSLFIFMCKYTPFQEIRFFFFNIKLSYLGIAFVFIDVIQIPYGNSGGHLAHLGGSFLGYFYADQLKKGTDIGSFFSSLISIIEDFLFGENKLKMVYKSKNKSKVNSVKKAELNQKKIDSILDKISVSGYDSLSQEEKNFLFNSKNN